jgi:hypothetical protein
MSKTRSYIRLTSAALKRQVYVNLKRVSGLLALALLLGVSPLWAEGPDDEYLQIRSLIQQADDLKTGGKTAPAKAKYEEAKAALTKFQRTYPEWNAKLVAFRLNDVAQKVAALTQKPPEAAGGDTATAVPAAPIETKAATLTSASPAKLLEPGAEPRKVLRLHPNPGDKQTLAMTVKMAMETKVGDAETPAIRLPAITMNMEATVKSVAENGDITYEMVMADMGVSDEAEATPEVTEAIKAAFTGLKGVSGSGTISSRGFSKGLEFKAPADSKPQVRQIVDQMKDMYAQLAIPLPEEAVGPGAKWEVKMPIKAQGMTIDQKATYEVVSLEGERLTTKSTLVQQAANQKVQNPALPGLKIDLTKMVGNGSGERTSELTHILPTTGTGKLHSESSMAMDIGGQKQAMTMKTDMNLRFDSK